MADFDPQTLHAVTREREVRLTTPGRRSGRPHTVTVWVSTDRQRVFIRSGGAMSRDWPQNLLTSGKGVLRVGGADVPVRARHFTEPAEVRWVAGLVIKKYGGSVRHSLEGGPPTLGEQATFELLPA